MSLSSSRPFRGLLTSLTTAATVLSVTVCGPASASLARQPQASSHSLPASMRLSPTPLPTIGQPAPEQSPNAPVTLNALHRTESGLVTLTWTITNRGYDNYVPPTEWVGIYDYANVNGNAPVSGITLTDEAAKIRYNPLRTDPDRVCICTNPGDQQAIQEKGGSEIMFETYKLPGSVKSVTVNIPAFSPAKNIPIS